jgi:hypothetical protein
MFYDWLRIIWYSLSKFVRWMKPEPLAVTVRQWVVFAVFSGSVFRADRYCLLLRRLGIV